MLGLAGLLGLLACSPLIIALKQIVSKQNSKLKSQTTPCKQQLTQPNNINSKVKILDKQSFNVEGLSWLEYNMPFRREKQALKGL